MRHTMWDVFGTFKRPRCPLLVVAIAACLSSADQLESKEDPDARPLRLAFAARLNEALVAVAVRDQLAAVGPCRTAKHRMALVEGWSLISLIRGVSSMWPCYL